MHLRDEIGVFATLFLMSVAHPKLYARSVYAHLIIPKNVLGKFKNEINQMRLFVARFLIYGLRTKLK